MEDYVLKYDGQEVQEILDGAKAMAGKIGVDGVALFDASKDYVAGDVVVYEEKIYKFVQNHSGAWLFADVVDWDLLSQIKAEKEARQQAIEAEAQARQDADENLQKAIEAEVEVREIAYLGDLGDFVGIEAVGFVDSLVTSIGKLGKGLGKYSFNIGGGGTGSKQFVTLAKVGSLTKLTIEGCLKAEVLNGDGLIDSVTSTVSTVVECDVTKKVWSYVGSVADDTYYPEMLDEANVDEEAVQRSNKVMSKEQTLGVIGEVRKEVNYYIYFNNYHIPSFSESINGYEGNQSITVTLPTDFRIQSLRGNVAIGHKMEPQTFTVESLQHLILNYKTFEFRVESYTAKLSDNELVLLAVGATDIRGLLAPHYYRWKNCQLNEKGDKLEKVKVDGLLSRDCVNEQTIDNTTTPYHINNYIDSNGRGRAAIVFKIEGGLSNAVVNISGLSGFKWQFGAAIRPIIGENHTYVFDKYNGEWLGSSKESLTAIFPKAEYICLLFRKPNDPAISEEEFEYLKSLNFSIKTALTDTYQNLSKIQERIKLVEKHSNYYIYFNNYSMPSFSESIDTYTGNQSITVTLPTIFRIQSLRGAENITHQMESQTFTIGSLQHLILNYKTFEFRVDSYTSKLSDDEIVLLAIGATDVHGLIAPHYYRWKSSQINEKNKSLDTEINNFKKDTNEGIEMAFVTGGDITRISDYSWFENIGYAIDENGRGRMWMYKSTSAKKGIVKITNIPSGYKVYASFGRSVYYNGDAPVLSAIGDKGGWRTDTFTYYQESNEIKVVGIWVAKSGDAVFSEEEFESLKQSITFEIVEIVSLEDDSDITNRYNTTEKVNIKSNLFKNCDFASMFLSDLHSSKAHWERVVKLANSWKANINCIIDGGDDTNSYTNNDDYVWFDSVAETSNLPILRAVGNHDAWTTDYWVWDTKENIYQIITSKVASQVNKLGETIYQPNNAEQLGLNYYYYDSGNVRVVVLCGLGMNGEKYYDDAQNNWLKSVLADAASNNKAVICVNHAPIKQNNSEPLDSNWYSKYVGWSNGEIPDHQHILNSALDCVDDFIDNGGTFICWLAGHTHVDYLMTTKNQKHKQMCFVTTCAMNRVGDGVKGSEPKFESYDSFNVLGVDTSKGLVKVWRIGYNLNATMQLHNAFVWDYRNKELLSEF